MRALRRLGVLAATGAAIAVAAPAAVAHVQVTPTAAAPGDPVLWEVLVPGEKDARTVEVALQIPRGVLPFSFEDTPGWRRQMDMADDGSIEVVRWRGRLARDGFARFAFLASAPEEEGEISWKAVQRYDDGSESAWIEPPDSEFPAAVTEISASAPRRNAGGEGAEAEEAPAGEATPAPTEEAAAAGGGSGDDDGGGNTLAIVLGAAGALMGAAALAISLRHRRPVSGSPG